MKNYILKDEIQNVTINAKHDILIEKTEDVLYVILETDIIAIEIYNAQNQVDIIELIIKIFEKLNHFYDN